MHSGNHYSVKEVILWTRRDIYLHLGIASIPTLLYVLFEWKWLSLPWLPIALLGTAVAFVVGFKNNASYDRLWEGRRVWGGIVNSSRSWAILAKDYVTNHHALHKLSDEALSMVRKTLYERHFAWLTALRFQLRERRPWESVYKTHNQEYKNKWFRVEEHEIPLSEALQPYLSREEYGVVMSKTNKAAQIIALQSAHLKELLEQGLIEDFRHMELQKILMELYTHQGASERLKNFPYPRQYATLNLWFIRLFIFLIPFAGFFIFV